MRGGVTVAYGIPRVSSSREVCILIPRIKLKEKPGINLHEGIPETVKMIHRGAAGEGRINDAILVGQNTLATGAAEGTGGILFLMKKSVLHSVMVSYSHDRRMILGLPEKLLSAGARNPGVDRRVLNICMPEMILNNF